MGGGGERGRERGETMSENSTNRFAFEIPSNLKLEKSTREVEKVAAYTYKGEY